MYSYTAGWAIARSVGSVATPFGYHLGMLQHPPSGSTMCSCPCPPAPLAPRVILRDQEPELSPADIAVTGQLGKVEKRGDQTLQARGQSWSRDTLAASLVRPFRPAMHPNGRRHPNATTAWASRPRKPGPRPGPNQDISHAGRAFSLPLPTVCTVPSPPFERTRPASGIRRRTHA